MPGMSGGKTSGVATWWRELTAARATDPEQARREYRARVVLVLQAVALSAVTLPVIMAGNAGLLRRPAVEMVVLTDLWVGTALWLAHRGRWRVSAIVSPALFVVLGLYGSWSWGLETPAVLSYAVAIVVAGMLHGTWVQWTVVGLSLAAHLIAGWLGPAVSAAGLIPVAITIGGAFVGIALLQSFGTRQLESAIGEARAHAARLAKRTAELVRANSALGQEVAERVDAQSQAQRRLQEMELVNQLGSLMALSGDVADVLPAVCAELARFLRVGQARLARLDPDRGVVEVIADCNSEQKSVGSVGSDPCMAYVLEHGAPLVMAAGTAGPELAAVQEMMQQHNAESLLAVPLTVGGRVTGALEFTAPGPVAFDRRHVDLVQQVANQAGQALMRQQAEADLRASEANYRATVDSMEEVIHGVDPEFRVTLYNTAFSRLCESLGIETGVINQTESGIGALLPDHVRDEYRQVFDSGKALITEETSAIGGRETVLEIRKIPVLEHGRVARVTTVARDITERKRAQADREATVEELRETRDYLENLIGYANAPIIVWDPELRITRFNRAFEHLTGRSAADVLGAGIDLLFPNGLREEAMAHIRRAIVGERWETVEIPILHLDGSVKTVLWNSATLYAADGVTPVATIAQGADVTERVRAQEQTRTWLREKEVLLREVHHRVRNNLQVVSSLLSMQARALQDEEAVQALRECEGRVWSMARIHDQLHRSTSLASIDMEQYVKELAASLIDLYGAVGVEVTVDAPRVKLALDQAIPCGLMLNELVTNCLKHAFPDGRAGQIDIVLSRREGRCELSVSDNGVGQPAGLDLEEPTTLGLTLVNILATQLKGKLTLDGQQGTVVRLSFAVGGAES